MTSSQCVAIIKREENEILQVTEAICYVKQTGWFLPVKSLVDECLSTVSQHRHIHFFMARCSVHKKVQGSLSHHIKQSGLSKKCEFAIVINVSVQVMSAIGKVVFRVQSSEISRNFS